MPNSKYFLVVKYKTKEEYEKNFKEIYHSGYQHGYTEGLQDALARLIYAFEHEFDSKDIAVAEQDQRNLGLKRWKKQRQYEDSIKKLAIREYFKQKERETDGLEDENVEESSQRAKQTETSDVGFLSCISSETF